MTAAPGRRAETVTTSGMKRKELADEFMADVGRIMRGMRFNFRRQMERYEVTFAQFHLMKLVKYNDGITVSELSHYMMISVPTVSRMIVGLCSKGLLEKERDSDDHRVTRLRLGKKSKALMDELTELQDKVIVMVFQEEDVAELETTVRHLGRLTDRWLQISESEAKKE